jgi:HPt (histidine-containing phosphotransfer) domain-containing protein
MAPPIVDPEAISNLRALSPNDGDAFLRELLKIFMEDTPARIAELHNCRASRNTANFVRAAHSIKGSSSNVGASELRAIAEQLEHQSRHNGLDEVAEKVAELEAAFVRARDVLTKLITN